MKILITGRRGQLGNELHALLSSGFAEIGPIPVCYSAAQVEYTDSQELDITDYDGVCNRMLQGKYDLVINCAAMTNVDACEDAPELAYAVNATGPRNLAIAAYNAGAKLVHISTDYVFSGNQSSARIEADCCDPSSVYGLSKLQGESFVTELCPSSYIVRTAWLYGYIGRNFVKTIIELARDNGAIRVVDDQFGNPTNANDLAYEILKIAQTENYGIYHCTNNGICSWFDFACAIVQAASITCSKTPISSAELSRKAKRPAFSSLDNKKLRDTIGDEMRTWQGALESYILHYLTL